MVRHRTSFMFNNANNTWVNACDAEQLVMLTKRAGIQERGECSEQTQLYPLSNERHFRDVLEPAVPAPSSSAAWGGGRRGVCLDGPDATLPVETTHSMPLAPDQRQLGTLRRAQHRRFALRQ